jgi:hypothetical protein
VGWLLLAFGLVAQALTSAAEGYARYGLLARPGMLPAATYLAMLASVTFTPGWAHRLHPAAHPDRVAAVAPLAPVAVLATYAGVLTENLKLAGWAVGLFLALLPLAISRHRPLPAV